MKINAQQADALGGCVECQPAATPPVAGTAAAIPSVVTVHPEAAEWIVIELVDAAGAPIAGEPYAVELADGRKITGKLDNLGRVRIEGVVPGECTVTFPERDAKEWKKR